VAQLVKLLASADALEYSIVVAATASDPAWVNYLFALLLVWHFLLLRLAGRNFLLLDFSLFLVSLLYAALNGFLYCKIMRHPSRLLVRNSPLSKVASIVAGVKAHVSVIKTGAGVIGIGLAYNEAHHILYPDVQTPIEKGGVLVGKAITQYTGYPSNPEAIDTTPFPSTKEGLESEAFKLQKQTIQLSHDERVIVNQKAMALERAKEVQRLLFEIKGK
jgi:hypothetical protein